MKNNIKVLFVIVGTLVGAGFVSGKEIYSFFFTYGKSGIVGILFSSIILATVVYWVLKICTTTKKHTYIDFLRAISGDNEAVSNVLNSVVDILLLITFYIMVSGFSAFCNQEIGGVLSVLVKVSMLVGCYIVFSKGVGSLVRVSNFLMPILVVFILYITAEGNSYYVNVYNMENGSIFNALVYGGLYACYNAVILVPVLVVLSKTVLSVNDAKCIGFCSGTVFFLLAMCVFLVLLQGGVSQYEMDMPLINIIGGYGAFHRLFYGGMIAVSIFTTAISTGTGFVKGRKANIWILMVGAVVAERISFSSIVGYVYPILGLWGVIQIGIMFQQWLSRGRLGYK